MGVRLGDKGVVAPDLAYHFVVVDDQADADNVRRTEGQAQRDLLALAAINTQTGTTYTLALTDQGDIVEMNSASANTLTIPTNAAVAFPVGARIRVTQFGAGTTTVQGDTGVTVNGTSAGSEAIGGQFQHLNLYQRAADDWLAQSGGGGGGTPGGSNKQVQYNNGGAFGGDPAFIFDDSSSPKKVTLTGDLLLDASATKLEISASGTFAPRVHLGRAFVDGGHQGILSLNSTGHIGWASGNAAISGNDTRIYRDAAGVVSIRRNPGTSPTGGRWWNTFTSLSDGEWAHASWQETANVFEIATKALGNGTQRSMRITAGSANILMPDLPTSDPSVAGALWNNSGVLTVSAG